MNSVQSAHVERGFALQLLLSILERLRDDESSFSFASDNNSYPVTHTHTTVAPVGHVHLLARPIFGQSQKRITRPLFERDSQFVDPGINFIEQYTHSKIIVHCLLPHLYRVVVQFASMAFRLLRTLRGQQKGNSGLV